MTRFATCLSEKTALLQQLTELTAALQQCDSDKAAAIAASATGSAGLAQQVQALHDQVSQLQAELQMTTNLKQRVEVEKNTLQQEVNRIVNKVNQVTPTGNLGDGRTIQQCKMGAMADFQTRLHGISTYHIDEVLSNLTSGAMGGAMSSYTHQAPFQPQPSQPKQASFTSTSASYDPSPSPPKQASFTDNTPKFVSSYF